jgi:hypothetical protein
MGGKENHGVSELYKTVSKLDPGIAERWKHQTTDDPKHELTAADIVMIVGPLLDGPKIITEDQCKAIVELFQKPRVSQPALAKLREYVNKIGSRRRFQSRKLTGDELKPVYAALGQGVTGRIMFQSPVSNISYAPFDYAAVANFVGNSLMSVFEIQNDKLYALATDAAFLVTGVDMMFLYHSSDPLSRTLTIVHEATHVIQSKRGRGIQRQYIEADAYVAQAIATYTLNNGKPYLEGLIHERAFWAAEWLLRFNDKSASSKEHWSFAYGEVVKMVAREYDNPTEAVDSNFKPNEERDRIVMFNRLAKMEEFLSVARDSIESTFPVRDALKQLFP